MMKAINSSFECSWRAILISAVLVLGLNPAFASLDKPEITSIQVERTNVVVTAQVPAGITKVTIEGRNRMGAGAWSPRAVARLDGNGGAVTFKLARSAGVEVLRVRADSKEPLPGFFYHGTNSFAGQPTTSDGSGAAPVNKGAGSDPSQFATGAINASPDNSASRQVVESDIWKISGGTLYFFNQYRGLQVVDISQPGKPVVRGTLPLPAVGEQMYLLESQNVVLLARDGCGWGTNGPTSQILIVQITNSAPQVLTNVPLAGSITESRLVGTALYVASEAYRRMLLPPNPKGGSSDQWEWGTQVSSFDLSDPSHPVARETLWFSGYGAVVTATDKVLLVATQDPVNWWRSNVELIDISAVDGSMKRLSSIQPAGRVADKYKMDVNGDVFTLISADNRNSGSAAVLETYSLADPLAPRKLGSLKVGPGESLFATRFDGTRVYLVTYFRIDPLWVVDLSDPTHPTLSGELKVPGYSTYLYPLGNRLVTMGVDTTNGWRVAVSLFDVRDPSRPSLLSRVPLGDNYSWSEANYDDKAFGVFPDAGLIIVPFQGYFTNGYASRVQLIDLNADSLVARGTIEHQFQPRRAAVDGDYILSISGQELLSVIATNRDSPVVATDTELAWSVDRVFVQGKYLIEIASGSYWPSQTGPSVRVVSASDPNVLYNELILTNLSFLGAAVQSNRLYIAQGRSTQILWPPNYDGSTNSAPPTTNAANLTLTTLDLSQLPALPRLGQAGRDSEESQYWGSLEALWPKPGVLVWSGSSGGWWPMMYGGVKNSLAGTPMGAASASGVSSIVPIGGGFRPWPWWGGSSGQLIAFDVNDPSAPKYLSQVDLSVTNGWWSFSKAYTADGLVYLGHEGSEFLPGIVPPWELPAKATGTVSPTGAQTPANRSLGTTNSSGSVTNQPGIVTNQPPIGMWVQRWYLDVIDYSDPSNPTVRTPVNIPGSLTGISHDGALLYTLGNHWDASNWSTDWSQWLDASAYDGVSVHLVDSLHLPATWPQPVLVADTNVFIGQPATTNAPDQLQTWSLSPAVGRFIQLGRVTLSQPVQNLVMFGNLVAAQESPEIDLFDASNPASLSLVGNLMPDGCVWYDLSKSSGSLDRGLWVPLGMYGVSKVSLRP